MTATLSFPSSVLDHILSFNPEHRDLWAEVMNDLKLATHCHSCGASGAICLRGYVGQHCSKQCWKWNELSADDEFDCLNGPDCKTCAGVFVSRANSRWHRAYHDSGSPTGACWPMGDTRRPCANECVRMRPLIKAGYGTEDDE